MEDEFIDDDEPDGQDFDGYCLQCGDPGFECDCEDEPDPPIDDDFPMYLEYDGLWGVSDWAAEDAAMREAEFEAEYFGFGGED